MDNENQDRATLVIERDALAKCVKQQKRIIMLLSTALVKMQAAFVPEDRKAQEAIEAVDVAGKALTDSGMVP